MRPFLIGLLALVTVGCGGSTTAPQSPSSGTPSHPGGGTTTPVASVSIMEYSFGPSDITVAKGTMITWTNDGTLAHTVTANGFSSGQLAPPAGGGYGYGMTTGQTYSMTFTAPGSYTYHCSNHPQMTGTITVTN